MGEISQHFIWSYGFILFLSIAVIITFICKKLYDIFKNYNDTYVLTELGEKEIKQGFVHQIEYFSSLKEKSHQYYDKEDCFQTIIKQPEYDDNMNVYFYYQSLSPKFGMKYFMKLFGSSKANYYIKIPTFIAAWLYVITFIYAFIVITQYSKIDEYFMFTDRYGNICGQGELAHLKYTYLPKTQRWEDTYCIRTCFKSDNFEKPYTLEYEPDGETVNITQYLSSNVIGNLCVNMSKSEKFLSFLTHLNDVFSFETLFLCGMVIFVNALIICVLLGLLKNIPYTKIKLINGIYFGWYSVAFVFVGLNLLYILLVYMDILDNNLSVFSFPYRPIGMIHDITSNLFTYNLMYDFYLQLLMAVTIVKEAKFFLNTRENRAYMASQVLKAGADGYLDFLVNDSNHAIKIKKVFAPVFNWLVYAMVLFFPLALYILNIYWVVQAFVFKFSDAPFKKYGETFLSFPDYKWSQDEGAMTYLVLLALSWLVNQRLIDNFSNYFITSIFCSWYLVQDKTRDSGLLSPFYMFSAAEKTIGNFDLVYFRVIYGLFKGAVEWLVFALNVFTLGNLKSIKRTAVNEKEESHWVVRLTNLMKLLQEELIESVDADIMVQSNVGPYASFEYVIRNVQAVRAVMGETGEQIQEWENRYIKFFVILVVFTESLMAYLFSMFTHNDFITFAIIWISYNSLNRMFAFLDVATDVIVYLSFYEVYRYKDKHLIPNYPNSLDEFIRELYKEKIVMKTSSLKQIKYFKMHMKEY